jgi:hypothetical protein
MRNQPNKSQLLKCMANKLKLGKGSPEMILNLLQMID